MAAYCRVSTDQYEQLESLETQRSHYDEYIRAHKDWELVNVYYDEGISGTRADTRPGLQRLMADCRLRRIDMVLTKSISRFARNTLDCLKHIRALKAQNIPVYFEKESINTLDAKGEIFLTIMLLWRSRNPSLCPRTSSLVFSTATSRERYRLTTAAFWATPRMRKAISSLIRNRLKS